MKRDLLRICAAGLICVFLHTICWGQVEADLDEIESLISEWNSANNERNVHSFQKVYAQRLSYYTQDLSRSEVIARKRETFNTKPWYRQRIVTEVQYKPYAKGAVRCDFTVEVFEKPNWKKIPSYLLVSFQGNHYAIVGEGDYATNRVRKPAPQVQAPAPVEEVVKARDTIAAIPPPAEVAEPDLKPDTSFVTAPSIKRESMLKVEDLSLVFSDMSALGVITIPRGYIIILVGMLGLGGIMIFIADSIHSSRIRRPQQYMSRHNEAEHVVRNFKTQAAFEAFVTTLFDPLYFRHRRPKTEYIFAGNRGQAERGPDLVFDFEQKDTSMRFAIKCQYYRHVAKNEVQLFDAVRLNQFMQFEADNDMDVYYVLGFGGTPDDPRELFFVPAKAVKSEYIHRTELRQYSKSGMFFYNRRTGKIQ